MKNKHITILLFLTIHLCFSQTKEEGIVSYKKENIVNIISEKKQLDLKNNNPQFYEKIKFIENNVAPLLKTIKFNLFFSGKESIFKVEKALEIENNRFYKYAIGPSGSGIYYNNLSENKYFYKQLEAYGEHFLIKNPSPKWKILKETKKIGDYTCYKAITVTEVKGRKGIISYPITAWYCPKLSFPFGPLGYNGLPGLILELETDNERYTVVKIKLNPNKEVKVKKPKKGKEVTKEEFEEIGLRTMSEFKKSIDK